MIDALLHKVATEFLLVSAGTEEQDAGRRIGAAKQTLCKVARFRIVEKVGNRYPEKLGKLGHNVSRVWPCAAFDLAKVPRQHAEPCRGLTNGPPFLLPQFGDALAYALHYGFLLVKRALASER